MHQIADPHEIRAVFSLKPLIDFWSDVIAPADVSCAAMLDEILGYIKAKPELGDPIEDLSILEPHWNLIGKLMTAVFPAAFWESEVVGALVPFTLRPVFVSPLFERLLLNQDGSFRGHLNIDMDAFARARLIRFYLLILRRCYGIQKDLDYPLIQIVEDPETGLERHFRFKPNLSFVDVHPIGELRKLSDRDLSTILEHLGEPEIVRQILPYEEFEFRGFTVIQALDVTESEVISYLERSLIDRESVFSPTAFSSLQQKLRTFFKIPDLVAGMAAIKGDQVLLLNAGCQIACECIFAGSVHVPTVEFRGSIFEKAVQQGSMLRIRDLSEMENLTKVELEFVRAGIRAFLVAPLYYQGEAIGVLNLGSMTLGRLGPEEELRAGQIIPVFSMALNRALDELENRVQAIIKEKCTAVHPSVEWMFRENVFAHLERLYNGESSEMEPVVFRDVFPFYAAADIRGSSEARNRAIQEDTAEHLRLGLAAIDGALEIRPLDIFRELAHRLRSTLQSVSKGMGSGDEVSAIYLLRKDVEPLFPFIRGFSPAVSDAVDAYSAAMDPVLGTVYCKRKDFEESVARLNDRIAAYLDREESAMQSVFPHYFNKHQTDGLDYLIYLGPSMVEKGGFNELYLKNMRLWQIIVSCGIAWQADRIKGSLKIPLELTHIILVNNSPMSIRFRFDEKRFDVDGAYDVGHEIVRSRIDKATVKGGDERLTQPGKIAIVYSRIQEAEEMRRHVEFLSGQGFLLDDLESLELGELPGVQGLKALRVSVDLDSLLLAERCAHMGPNE